MLYTVIYNICIQTGNIFFHFKEKECCQLIFSTIMQYVEFVNRISDVSCHWESISTPSCLMVWNEVGSVRSKHCLLFRNRTWLHGTTWHNLFPLYCLLWILNFQDKTLLIQLFEVLAWFQSHTSLGKALKLTDISCRKQCRRRPTAKWQDKWRKCHCHCQYLTPWTVQTQTEFAYLHPLITIGPRTLINLSLTEFHDLH